MQQNKYVYIYIYNIHLKAKGYSANSNFKAFLVIMVGSVNLLNHHIIIIQQWWSLCLDQTACSEGLGCVSDATVTQTIRGSEQKLCGWQVVAWNHERKNLNTSHFERFCIVCMCVSRFLFMCNTKAGEFPTLKSATPANNHTHLLLMILVIGSPWNRVAEVWDH